jgi:hypothetical protein
VVDDYSKEIRDLEAQHDDLVQAEGDQETIQDLGRQIDILHALYARARQLFVRGLDDPDLRAGLKIRGYGDWTLDNVYAFVYERSVELPEDGHGAFLVGIREADFAGQLRA